MIDYSKFAIPKVNVGLKLSPYRYRQLKGKIWEKQGGRCKKCGHILRSPVDGHLHHYRGRGLGGGKRDDRKTYLLCPDCHLKEHN